MKSLLHGRRPAPRLAGGARRVLHLPEPPQRPDALRRRASAAGRAHADRRPRTGARGPSATGTSSFDPDDERAAEEWTERIRGVFEEVVTRQLISDVPVGSYLSGGMDSASIAAVASRHVPRLMTFTGGFDLTLGHRPRAGLRRAAPTPSSSPATSAPSTTRWSCTRATWPGRCPSWSGTSRICASACRYPNYYVAGLASKFVKVALGGAGGDELFARLPVALRARRASSTTRRRSTAPTTTTGRGSCPDGEKAGVLHAGRPARARGDHSPFDALPPDDRSPAAGLDPLSKALYFEAKTFLHGLLVVEDKVSMAHSLEVRVPFLDNELVDARRADPEPAQARRAAAARSCCATRWRRCCRRTSSRSASRASARPTSPGTAARRWTTSARSCSTARSLERGYFEPAYVKRVLARAPRGPRQPPAADLVAALLRVVEPALHGRRRRDRAGRTHVQPPARHEPDARRDHPLPGLPRRQAGPRGRRVRVPVVRATASRSSGAFRGCWRTSPPTRSRSSASSTSSTAASGLLVHALRAAARRPVPRRLPAYRGSSSRASARSTRAAAPAAGATPWPSWAPTSSRST